MWPFLQLSPRDASRGGLLVAQSASTTFGSLTQVVTPGRRGRPHTVNALLDRACTRTDYHEVRISSVFGRIGAVSTYMLKAVGRRMVNAGGSSGHHHWMVNQGRVGAVGSAPLDRQPGSGRPTQQRWAHSPRSAFGWSTRVGSTLAQVGIWMVNQGRVDTTRVGSTRTGRVENEKSDSSAAFSFSTLG